MKICRYRQKLSICLINNLTLFADNSIDGENNSGKKAILLVRFCKLNTLELTADPI